MSEKVVKYVDIESASALIEVLTDCEYDILTEDDIEGDDPFVFEFGKLKMTLELIKDDENEPAHDHLKEYD